MIREIVESDIRSLFKVWVACHDNRSTESLAPSQQTLRELDPERVLAALTTGPMAVFNDPWRANPYADALEVIEFEQPYQLQLQVMRVAACERAAG